MQVSSVENFTLHNKAGCPFKDRRTPLKMNANNNISHFFTVFEKSHKISHSTWRAKRATFINGPLLDKNWWKMPNWKILMRHFGWFSNTVHIIVTTQWKIIEIIRETHNPRKNSNIFLIRQHTLEFLHYALKIFLYRSLTPWSSQIMRNWFLPPSKSSSFEMGQVHQ